MDPSTIIAQLLSGTGVSVSQLPSQVDFSLGNILRALIILILMYFVARIFQRILRRALRHWKLEPSAERVILQVAFYLVIGLGVIWALGGFGLSVVLLGIAVGFALKDLIENFAAGLLLLGTRPFQPGDWIEVNNIEGVVEEVGWRGTFVDTFDGRRVILPNSMLVKNVVTNNSRKPELRSTMHLTVDLSSDFTEVESLILNALKGIEGIAQDPPPTVLIDSMTGSAMNLLLWIWITEPLQRRRRTISAALNAVKEALVSNEIQMNPTATAPLLSKNSNTK